MAFYPSDVIRVTKAEGDVLTLYATAGSTSRYCWVSNLIIEEV